MRHWHVPKRRSRSIAHVTIATALGLFAGGSLAPLAIAGGGGWSSATAISPTNQPDPTRGAQVNDVAVNTKGDAVAAWDQYTYTSGGGATIGVAVQSGGRWNPPFTISPTNGFAMNPKVAVGTDGTMAVAWSFETPVAGPAPTRSVQVAVKPAGASAWTVTTLATAPQGGVAIPQFVPVAVDAGGNVTAAWTLWNGQQHVVQAAHRLKIAPPGAANNGWSIDGTIAFGDGLYPGLAVNARGDAGVVFSVSPYTSSAGTCDPAQPLAQGTCAIYVFRNGPTGPWDAPVTVSQVLSSSVGYISGAQAALDANGLATVIWFGNGIEGRRQISRTAWSGARAVIPVPANMVGASFLSPDLAVDQNGDAVVAVSIFDPTVGVDRASVWASYVLSGEWSANNFPQPVRITDPTVPVDAYATRAAISADGSLAMVGWIDHYHGVVQVSQLDNTTGAWGAGRTIGRGTAFSAFQEVLGLDVGSGMVARAIWKSSAKGGTRTMAASYTK